jgi:hypothetical protein
VAPTGTAISLSAAKNEFEAFQIVVAGGTSGVTGVNATASDLTSGVNTISSSEIMLYYAAVYNVVNRSNGEGALGEWFDALIPKVDAYYHEARNAFPFDVPAGKTRVIWVELFVPIGTAAGTYTGTVTVTGTGIPTTAVTVTLLVRDFTLPSTATMRSYFAHGDWDGACGKEMGGYVECGQDEGVKAWMALFQRAGLDHRMSLGTTYAGVGTSFLKHFGPQLSGTGQTRLVGAKLTSANYTEATPANMAKWKAYFDAHGWKNVLFTYIYDEPNGQAAFDALKARADVSHAAGIPTLATVAKISDLAKYGVETYVDWDVPLVNFVWDKDYFTGVSTGNKRPDADAFLKRPGTELWAYQSCMSHGCSGNNVEPNWLGRPSYMIDTSGVANRIMEWWSFRMGITGELYWNNTNAYRDAWTTGMYSFGGNGDGTLFWPGRPVLIGGTHHIPLESIRVKLIRESMEDYEYLAAACAKGAESCASVHSIVETLLPAPYNVAGITAAQLYTARSAVADLISPMSAPPAPPVPAPAQKITIPITGSLVIQVIPKTNTSSGTVTIIGTVTGEATIK